LFLVSQFTPFHLALMLFLQLALHKVLLKMTLMMNVKVTISIFQLIIYVVSTKILHSKSSGRDCRLQILSNSISEYSCELLFVFITLYS